MTRIINTVIVGVAFLAMLAATSPKRPPVAPVTATPRMAIPPSAAWPVHELAGVTLRVPPGVVVDGTADAIVVHMHVPVTFDRVTGERADLDRERAWYQTKAPGFQGYLLDDPDALVAQREENPVGVYCEVTACSAAKTLCTRAGLALDSTARLTGEECGQVVAIARSIR